MYSGSKAIPDKLIKKKFNKFLQKVNFNNAEELYICIAMNIESSLCKNFKTLKDLRAIFKTNEDCIRFLEELIWEGEPVSPYDKTSKVYKCKDGWYKCKNTGKEFNILTGTLFQGTKIDLTTWFEVIFRENSDKSGLAATTVMRDYGITYTAAWNMLHKIRNAMSKENHQELSGTVEVDEYHAGGSLKNISIGCASGSVGKQQLHRLTPDGGWPGGAPFMERMVEGGKAISEIAAGTAAGGPWGGLLY